MRSRVVSQQDIHEKYGVEVKPFDPSFVIPRHVPGWERMESVEAQGMIFRPATMHDAKAHQAAKQPIYIEVNPKA